MVSRTRIVEESSTLGLMTTISIVHTKGGVGKTTSSIYLATAAARQGVDVVVIDGDPQRSASVWSEQAAGRGFALPFRVMETHGWGLVVPDQELVIIDTPPGTSDAIQQAVDTADLVLIPCGASPIELERVWPTMTLTQGSPTVVLMTQVDLRANMVAKVQDELQSRGVPVLNTLVTQRQSIKKAFGTLPIDLEAYWDVWEELAGVVVGV